MIASLFKGSGVCLNVLETVETKGKIDKKLMEKGVCSLKY